jgi:hypothetical protein
MTSSFPLIMQEEVCQDKLQYMPDSPIHSIQFVYCVYPVTDNTV